jgi:hypothetical protein
MCFVNMYIRCQNLKNDDKEYYYVKELKKGIKVRVS